MSKWISPDGAELESCCVLTTEPNELIKPFHHRIYIVVPNGFEKQWTEQVKDTVALNDLLPTIIGWSPDGWLVEHLGKKETNQISLF